jgi:hypothetical protein
MRADDELGLRKRRASDYKLWLWDPAFAGTTVALAGDS